MTERGGGWDTREREKKGGKKPGRPLPTKSGGRQQRRVKEPKKILDPCRKNQSSQGKSKGKGGGEGFSYTYRLRKKKKIFPTSVGTREKNLTEEKREPLLGARGGKKKKGGRVLFGPEKLSIGSKQEKIPRKKKGKRKITSNIT